MAMRSFVLFSMLCISVCAFPFSVRAQVIVSEFMYDLSEGSDTGREWVEIFNESGSSIDLTTWKLFEAETNHKITEFQGGLHLPSGGYAIIADNPAKFLSDWPAYNGLLFDSAFSLGNAGETFAIRNVDLVDIDTVSYTADMGAAGDGNSLTRNQGGGFAAATPTPGSGSLAVTGEPADAPTDNTTPASDSEDSAVAMQQNLASNFPVEPQIFAYAGKDRSVLVGADVIFEGQALSKDGELLEGSGVRYVWNFGDGRTSEDKTVAHHFSYPGTYTVFLDVSSGKYSGSDRVTITARDPQLVLSRLSDGGVRIENHAAVEVDISFWHVKVVDSFFSIPKHTVILPKNTITLREDATHLPSGNPVLVYPNGVVAVASSGGDVASNTSVASPTTQLATGVTKITQPEYTQTVIGMPVYTEDAPRDGNLNVDQEAEEVSEQILAQTGSASESGQVHNDLWLWLLGLVGTIGIGGVAFMFAIEGTKTTLKHDGWFIEEDPEVR